MTRCFVLHPDLHGAGLASRSAEAMLAEAVNLAEALALEIAGAEIAPLTRPRPGWLFGAGKVEDLGAAIGTAGAELVVINHPLTPKQQQNLEKAWGVKAIDRTGLILEIFGDRAQTREGALQVELAHLEYQRSRLVRSWTHLERQRGGFGFVGGPGETQIEADRRMLDDRMVKIRRMLAKTVRTRGLQRAARKRIPYPIVALVGYTNAGKSTLFNRLTGAGAMAKDMLFATLDPTMRAMTLPGGATAILSDTVGFVADLPTQLIAAFRATLEEVVEADLVLHVRDAAHPDSAAQDADVRATLAELGFDDARLSEVATVYNKVDLLDAEARIRLSNQVARDDRALMLSAATGDGVDALAEAVRVRLRGADIVRHVVLDHAAGAAAAWLHRKADVISRENDETGLHLQIAAPPGVFAELEKRFSGALKDAVPPALDAAE